VEENGNCCVLLQVGLALSYAAPIVTLLGSFLSSFTETEKEMVSVERALQVL
jgi:ATP-binding cassette subfamily C (CFTR/MRP) protein 10